MFGATTIARMDVGIGAGIKSKGAAIGGRIGQNVVKIDARTEPSGAKTGLMRVAIGGRSRQNAGKIDARTEPSGAKTDSMRVATGGIAATSK
jgi:hypothetical protein